MSNRDYTNLNKSNYDKLSKIKKTWYNIKRDELLLIREMINDGSFINNRALKQLDSLISKLNNTISGDILWAITIMQTIRYGLFIAIL